MRTQGYPLPARNRSQAVLEAYSGIVEPGDSQGAFNFYSGPPDPHEAPYQGFSPDTSKDDAAAVFRRRYGQAPAFVFPSLGGLLLAGPIPVEVGP